MKGFLLLWSITLLLDNRLPFLLAPFYKGYRHREMALSVLGCRESPVKWVYNLWCVLSGILFCAAGFPLYSAFPGGLAAALWVLLAVYGVGCEILSGFFPLAGTVRDRSRTTQIHGAGSALGFTALLFAPLLLGIAGLRAGETVLGVLSLLCFAVALVCFAFFIMGEKEAFRNTVLRFGGYWQRMTLAACYVPLLYFSLCGLLAG